MALDNQIPANFKLEGTDQIIDTVNGVPQNAKLEFKTFHRVLLDASRRRETQEHPVVTI